MAVWAWDGGVMARLWREGRRMGVDNAASTYHGKSENGNFGGAHTYMAAVTLEPGILTSRSC
jgi:hypothetical protein